MSKRNWGRPFVSGLALGLILAFSFFAFLEWAEQPINQAVSTVADQGGRPDPAHDEQTNSPEGWPLLNWALSGEGDTVAQWIMAFFAFVAAGLLWWTLKATQKMARDTREIGEAQVRAYLTVDEPTVTPEIEQHRVIWCLNFRIRNCGQSPAKKITVKASGELFGAEGHSVAPDLGASADEPTSVILTTSPKNLIFVDKEQTKILFRAHIHIWFCDIFAECGDRTPFNADFIGVVPVVPGNTVALSNAGTAISENYYAGQ